MGQSNTKQTNRTNNLPATATAVIYPHEHAFQKGLALIRSRNYLEAAYQIDLASNLGSIKASRLFGEKLTIAHFLGLSFEYNNNPWELNGTIVLDSKTHFKLAICALLGIGTEQNDLKACDHYQLATEQGLASAQYHLAWMYQKGRAEPALSQAERDAKACHYYQLAIEQGLAEAQSNLAWMYQKGRAETALSQAERDAKACHYYQLAAEQGLASAQNNLAWMYEEGRVEPALSQAEREAKACHYYQLAIEQGLAAAQYALALMYQKGRAEPALSQAEREAKACHYYQLAIEQGLAEAQNNLAWMYQEGRAEPALSQAEREAKACHYYQLAIEQGLAEAQSNLAWMYQKGRAEPALSQAERDAKACHYYQLAAEQGLAEAQSNLAWMYQKGRAEPALTQTERYTKAHTYWKLVIQGGQKKELIQFFQKHYSMSERLSGFLVDFIENPLPIVSGKIDIPDALTCAITFSLPRVPVRLFGQGPYCLFSLMQCRLDPQTNQAFSYATDVHPAYDIRDQIIHYAASHQAPAALQLAKPLSRSAFFQEAGCQTEALPEAPTVTPTFWNALFRPK